MIPCSVDECGHLFCHKCEPEHTHPERPKAGRLEPEEWLRRPEQEHAASRAMTAALSPQAQARVKRGL
eukprot:10922343-Alexandrium_andersonii.AAC.1